MTDLSYLKVSLMLVIGLFMILSFSACDTDNELEEPVIETGSVTDVEGNEYRTVKIGDQWWMAEDLKVTSFRSGNAIGNIQSDEQWSTTAAPAYCVYNNGNIVEATSLLYNFYVVNNPVENIAPEGWHIPTDDEWKELERFLGMNNDDVDNVNWRGTNEGDRLKIEGTEGWESYEGVWASNETGFSAIGGSSRFFQGPFGVPGLKGSEFWWTSTANEEKGGWYRYLDYKKSGIFRFFGNPNYGFSIRCVKDY